jgi:hypothetical protein
MAYNYGNAEVTRAFAHFRRLNRTDARLDNFARRAEFRGRTDLFPHVALRRT